MEEMVVLVFQYRKRYEITCDNIWNNDVDNLIWGFNTASGMRSHVTSFENAPIDMLIRFQYRKRYEITCDAEEDVVQFHDVDVSIPQAV